MEKMLFIVNEKGYRSYGTESIWSAKDFYVAEVLKNSLIGFYEKRFVASEGNKRLHYW